ncbi:hypothetical protein [Tolypothrix sp. FACHB-123]|nr:hypothetical protein [Tolypothrix sp. FACHB-123]
MNPYLDNPIIFAQKSTICS